MLIICVDVLCYKRVKEAVNSLGLVSRFRVDVGWTNCRKLFSDLDWKLACVGEKLCPVSSQKRFFSF